MDADSFLPTDAERKRVFGQLTMAPPLDEPSSEFCVFQRLELTKSEQRRHLDFHRIYYRQRTYHPKFLLAWWYFPHSVDHLVSRSCCPHNEKCVNPFHLFVKDEKKEKQGVESPLLAAEKKRKADELELTSTPEIKLLEEYAFSRKPSDDTVQQNNDDFLTKKRRFEALFQRDND